MKIIFLDIDGVMIKYPDQRENRISRSDKYEGFVRGQVFNMEAVDALNKIVFETNAYIVISSSWRYNLERTKEAFIQAGLDWNRVISATKGGLYHGRGNEILTWIFNYNKTCNPAYLVTDWVVIDDDSFDMKAIDYLGFLVKTKTNEGLTEQKAMEAILILNKK